MRTMSPLLFVELREKVMRQVAHGPSPCLRDGLQTRMLLSGEGWNLARLPSCAGLRECRAPLR